MDRIRGVRWRRSAPLLGALVLLLGLTGVVAAAAAPAGRDTAAAGGRAWTIKATRNPASADISALSSVSCSTRRACTAVGVSARSLSSWTLPLAERWNGTRWRLQSIPAPKRTSDTLYGVSCPSARWCVAVGDAFHNVERRDEPLMEAWNGHRWRVQPTAPRRGASTLSAVSCASRSSCTAVGFTLASRHRAIVERWNGSTWRAQAVPRLAGSTLFLGVSCAKVRACTAVGYQSDAGTRPLAESWNGKRWRVRAVRLRRSSMGGLFDSVSCTSPTACTATGTQFEPEVTLAERWNGRTWRVERTPNPADYALSFGGMALDSVSCTAANACTASGEYSPHGAGAYFVETWNGRSWRLEAVPHPGDFQHGVLMGVSCVSARCTAVGAYTGAVRLQVTLALAN